MVSKAYSGHVINVVANLIDGRCEISNSESQKREFLVSALVDQPIGEMYISNYECFGLVSCYSI